MDDHQHMPGASPECAFCPVCVLLQAISTSRPEITAHLLAAGRELSLALAAAADVSAETLERAAAAHEQRHGEAADSAAPAPPRLRRIPVE